MANRRREPVSYRPFRTEPLLAEGLLAVQRDGGEFLQRVSAGLFRLADEAGVRADAQATRAGARAGEQAALAGRPQAEIPGIPPATAGAGVNVTGGNHRSIAAQILRKEEGFRESPYWDVNAFRTGYGSDTVTTADGNVVKVAKGMKVTRADAERDLARRLGDFEGRAAGQTGLENWNRLPAAARGALLSVTYNYGSLPRSVVAAVKGGDPAAIARAVGGLSANKSRRQREAAIIAGGVAPSADPVTTASTSADPAGAPVIAGGGYRPTGRDTVYGRAYDAAGTKTYVQMLETEMRSTTSQLFERHKDDPVALERAFGDLKGALKREHVFGEIEADYEIGFDSLAQTYLSQARDNLGRKVEAEDRAAFIERTGVLATDREQRIAGFDPASEGAADSIAAAQAAIDAHYDDAVDRGILDPDDAATAKIASRRDAALGFYGKQADALDADGVKAMREEMTADFADGGVEGLDGDGFAALDGALRKLEDGKRRDQARLAADFLETGERMAARVAAGFEVDPAQMSEYMLEAGRTPEGKAALAETFSKLAAGRAIRDFSVRDGEKHLAGLKKQYGAAPTDGELRTLIFAEQMLQAKKTAIATDPVSYAEAQEIVPATPLLTEAETAEGMSTILADRVKAAGAAAEALGIPPRYLKAGEAAALAKVIQEKPAEGAAIAGAIVAGAGSNAAAVLAEFGDDAPMISQAGAILAFGGSARAAEDVILGYGKGVDGKKLTGLKPDAARTSAASVIGGALPFAPRDRARIAAAAAAIARKRISEQGVDPASEEAIEIHDRAVQEAAGASFDRGVQFGGFTAVGGGLFADGLTVLVPPSIRADLFDDLLGALTDEDFSVLAQKPAAGVAWFGLFGGDRLQRSLAGTLAGALPVAVNGGYAFAFGDPSSDDPQFVQGDDGGIFVLNPLKLRERLAPRVPGAFK